MTLFWQRWLYVWCGVVTVFGLILCGAGLAATGAPSFALLHILNPSVMITVDAPLRCSIGLMGAVTFGWGLTLFTTIRAALALGDWGGSVWRSLLISVGVWYLIDSFISIATGFGLNAVSNTVLLLAFLLPILRTGVLSKSYMSSDVRTNTYTQSSV